MSDMDKPRVNNYLSKEDEERIDRLFAVWNEGVCPGGQVGVRYRGEVIYQKCFGYANLEHRIPISDTTVFHIASMSKQMTAMAILLLHEDGKLHIDDDIRLYLADIVHFSEPVTIRQLMNHTSGIRDQFFLLNMCGVRIEDTITQADTLRVISWQRNLNFKPGSAYAYSNSNYTLMAEIVTRVSGMSMTQWCRKRIFEPLGMTRTVFQENFWQVIPDRADSYENDGYNSFAKYVLNFGTYGATALNSCVTDYLKWFENLTNPTICSQETLRLMKQRPVLDNGSVSEYAGGITFYHLGTHEVFGHSGGDAQYRSNGEIYPDDGLEIIIFSNTGTRMPADLTRSIASLILKLEQPQGQPDLLQTDQAPETSRMAGFYLCRESLYYSCEITLRDGVPYVSLSYEGTRMTHLGGNHYSLGTYNMDCYFDETGFYARLGEAVMRFDRLQQAILPPEKAAEYTGEYFSPELKTRYLFTVEAGVLTGREWRDEANPCYKVSQDQFICRFGRITERLFFRRDESDEVVGLDMENDRVFCMSLTKTKYV